MRPFFTLSIPLTLCFWCLCSSAETANQDQSSNFSIIVHISNIRCCDGVIMLALYDAKENWLDAHGMLRGRLSIANSTEQTIELHGLPAGEYAIAVIQDLNQNQTLDRRLGILPREPYGFSNNTGRYGPGKYKNAKFTLMQNIEMGIELIDRGN